jgi:hypothetical protein
MTMKIVVTLRNGAEVEYRWRPVTATWAADGQTIDPDRYPDLNKVFSMAVKHTRDKALRALRP